MCFPNWKQRRRRRRRISWRFNQQSTAESRFADFELPTSSRRQTGAAATERQIPVFPFEKEEEEEEKERVCRRKKKVFVLVFSVQISFSERRRADASVPESYLEGFSLSLTLCSSSCLRARTSCSLSRRAGERVLD